LILFYNGCQALPEAGCKRISDQAADGEQNGSGNEEKDRCGHDDLLSHSSVEGVQAAEFRLGNDAEVQEASEVASEF